MRNSFIRVNGTEEVIKHWLKEHLILIHFELKNCCALYADTSFKSIKILLTALNNINVNINVNYC